MSIKREVAILEVYLDQQAELAEPEPKLKVYDRVGQVSAAIGILILIVWYWRML